MTKYILIFALSTIAAAQTAKVVPLSPEDAAQAKSLAEQRKLLDDKQESLNEHIRNKYLAAGPKEDYDCIATTHIKRGWGCGGFQFSEDFKYIVPASVPPRSNPALFTTPVFSTLN